MVQRAAVEEVGHAPQRVEEGVIDESLVHSVPVVDEDHDREAQAAVQEVHHAETLHAQVGHGVEGTVHPDGDQDKDVGEEANEPSGGHEGPGHPLHPGGGLHHLGEDEPQLTSYRPK